MRQPPLLATAPLPLAGEGRLGLWLVEGSAVELKALLRECVENPEDDAPRLVLADWLDDNGEPDHAEYVRGQVAIAHMEESDPGRRALAARMATLHPQHFKGWVTPLHGQVSSYWFNRGLLRLSIWARQVPELEVDAESEGWDWVERVVLCGPWTPQAFSQLTDSRLASRFVTLDIDEAALKLAGASTLAGCPWLANLRGLSLWRNNIGTKGAVALAASPFVANLRSLDLSFNRIGVEGVEALANSPYLHGLQRLDLRDNGIGPLGAVAIAESDTLANLCCLLVLKDNVGEAGAAALQKRFGDRVQLLA